MSPLSQTATYLKVDTPLGEDKLLVTAFHGDEYLSGLFHFELELISEDDSLDFSQIVGKSATVGIDLPGGETRYFNGLVTRFEQAESDPDNKDVTCYYAELRPWLWMLSLASDCRIFQNKPVPDILTAVFSDLGYTDYDLKLTGTYEPRTYCVQYNETALNFVCRLMEDEGIFYFFTHETGKHTLVLADSSDAHQPCPNLPSGKARKATESYRDIDIVTRCMLAQQVNTGKYASRDFSFETPAAPLAANVTGTGTTLEHYEYPGGYQKTDAGEARANRRIEGYELTAKTLRGESYCAPFVPGHTFNLTDHPRGDFNKSYVLRAVSHTASQEAYDNTFEAFPADTPFRPPRTAVKPVITSSQTAIVVGKSGEEIWTDNYGRIKVQFHWDRQGKSDENSSCWIRVAHIWAGQAWGGFLLPRMGQEVVVSFLNGDPDHPLVVGSVYNAQQTVPYGLPGEQTKSTLKSNSSKGGGGFNEIRFEDLKDSEEIYVHAQKDMNITIEHDRTKQILNDETNTIKQNRTTTIQEGNETVTLEKGGRTVTLQEGDETLTIEKGNRTVQVNTGNETHTVKDTRTLTITGDETHTNEANFMQEVKGNFKLTVSGDLEIDVKGSVTIKAGKSLTTKAGTSLTDEAGTSLTNKAGTGLTNQAGTTLTSKASASQTVDGGGMLTLKGGLVKIN